jgi:sphinganine-1-phosphate aldolase
MSYIFSFQLYWLYLTIFITANRHYFSKYYLKKLLILLPYVRNKINAIKKDIANGMISKYQHFNRLPIEGLTEIQLNTKINTMKSSESKNLSGVIYNNDKEHNKRLLKIFERYMKTNPLHADTFPEIRIMEADIISMTSGMFKGDVITCGNVTTGGTESILLACYTYREYCRNEYGITRPNIVAFNSVHPAFDKACHMFGISLRKADSFWKLKWLTDWNTICMIGSAPTYAYGIIDPISEMAKYCYKKNIPLHIDCCMGGFLLPFLNDNPVSFESKGITSISADTHKYGNCFKGSSVLLFSNPLIKRHQHFIKTDWEGGMYATPTIMGSKSGALIATTWASLLYMGEDKFTKIANEIRRLLRIIKDHYTNNKYIKIIGNPDVNIIAFESGTVPIYSVINQMKTWDLSIMANPPSFHLCITSVHTEENIVSFIQELDQAIQNVLLKPDEKLEGTLAIYGSATKVENSIFTEDVVNDYLHLLSTAF